MVHFELLVGADAFWKRAAKDFAQSRRRLFVQAMTFEGDSAGLAVAAAIKASPAGDRRVLVDEYTRHVISDRSVHAKASKADQDFQSEVRATHAMFSGLVDGGVCVRVTNPVGPLFTRYPARNHKKLIVADDAAYIGGVNFSDHNFAWHDFMLRIEGADLAEACAEDFIATFEGRPRASNAEFGPVRLISMDGRSNRAAFAEIMALIEGARRSVTIISPYLTFPVTGALAQARRRGVAVELITPLANNKRLVRDYLLWAAKAGGLDVRLQPHMSHLKGMLIDDERLVIGSSNFDFVSLGAEEELVAVIADPRVIADFRAAVIDPAVAEALPASAHTPSTLAGLLSLAQLKFAQGVVGAVRGVPRGAYDYPAG
ncbi:MAG: phosphatidylserine/phosphatidylglycerophosphate/cardiolipin synthase family protein [Proteobacteria bacterium]|nr:phosphatidylserine/phosphatidylglycerophosphate/cardiolipin synthase family protein [Pseudomonadota bacterium]